MTEAPIILDTFALSHFCENARWALDHKGIAYREQSWAPMLHMFRTWRLKRTYTPVLRIDGEIIQESAAICAYLEQRFPEPVLIPAEHREAVLRAADEARSIGPHVRRLAYFAFGKDLKLLERAWALNVGVAEARVHKLIFPVSRRMVFKALRVNRQAAEESQVLVRDFLARGDTWLTGTRRYLVGDTFTLADLTTASILSPLARPREHPTYARMSFGEAAENMVDSFRSSNMLAWVRDCYARHRASRGPISAPRG
jgi:glutathione S-transferase